MSGELVFGTVPRLLEDGRMLFESGTGSIDVDLREVTRADSAGLALLIEWLRTARGRGRSIVFRNVPPQMASIAKVSSVTGLLGLEG